MANIAADPWQIPVVIAPQMHPQIADEASHAMIGDPDRVMVAMEDEPEPVGRVANLVPIEACARVCRLMVSGDCCDQPREFGDIVLARPPVFH